MIHYDIALLVAFVRQFVMALAIDPWAVVGYSLGGWVASAYALAYPEGVNCLILAAPAGIRDDNFQNSYRLMRPLVWQTPMVDWVLAAAQPLATLLGQAAAWQNIRTIRRELNLQPAPRSFLIDRLKLADRLRPEDKLDTVEKEIHRLQMPTLVITGDQDDTIPLWHSQTYATQIPQAELQIISQANHALPQSYPQAMAN